MTTKGPSLKSLAVKSISSWNEYTDEEFIRNIGTAILPPELKEAIEEQLDPDRLLLLASLNLPHWEVQKELRPVGPVKRIRLAAKRNDRDALDILLHQHPVEVDHALIGAAEGGHRSLIEQWLPHSRTGINAILTGAAEGGQTGIIEWLLATLLFSESEWQYRRYEDPGVGFTPDPVIREAMKREYTEDLLVMYHDITNAMDKAARRGHINIVRLLLPHSLFGEHGSSLIRLRPEHILVAVAERGHIGVVKLLLSDAQFTKLDRALEAAARKGHTDVVELLLSDKRVSGLNRALVAAAQNGHIDVVRLLLPTWTSTVSPSTFRIAAERGHVEMIRLLLDLAGAQEVYLTAALVGAASGDHRYLVELLLAEPAIIITDDALAEAAANGNIGIVKLLLSDPRYENPNLGRAFVAAAGGGNVNVVEFLMQDPRVSDFATALDLAVSGGHPGVVQLLMSVTAATKEMLLNSARRGYTDVVGLLLTDPGITGIDEALIQAVEEGRTEIVRLLLSDPRLVGIDKALIAAAKRGKIEIVKMILANPRAETIDLNEAFAVAAEHSSVDVLEFLAQDPRVTDFTAALYRAVTSGSHNIDAIRWLSEMLGVVVDEVMLIDSTKWMRSDFIRLLLSATPGRHSSDFLAAVINGGHLEIAEELLADRTLLHLGESLHNAVAKGYHELARKITQHPGFSHADWYKARSMAQRDWVFRELEAYEPQPISLHGI